MVLVIDPISQGERYQITDVSGKPLTRGGTTEHTLLNASSNLLGTSIAAYELWDNARGLDYLITRPEVDTSRIGCLGNSGGAIQTIYFSTFDRRVKVAAVCSYLSNRERTMELTGAADGCAQIPDEGTMHLEMCDYLIAGAPNPVLVLAGRYDFIDYTGTVLAVNDMKQIYKIIGQPQRVSLFTVDDGHGITKPKREAAVSWFRRWLCNDTTPVTEPDLSTLPPNELFCTPTGQVNAFYKDEITIAQRNVVRYDDLHSGRNTFLQKSRKEIVEKVKELLSLKQMSTVVNAECGGEVKKDSLVWQKVILRKEYDLPLPLLVTSPAAGANKIILWCSDAGKNVVAESLSLIQQYRGENAIVMLCDLRGTGETADKPELNDPKYYNKEYRNAMLALHVGQTLVGQRVKDVLTVVDFVSSNRNYAGLPIELHASGIAALPALHAMLFTDRVVKLNLYNLIPSFTTILNNPIEKHWYSSVIPRVLQFYDIPDLLMLVGEQKVQLLYQ
ncbi:MAG: hypothetical protein V1799_11210 [bacterium]